MKLAEALALRDGFIQTKLEAFLSERVPVSDGGQISSWLEAVFEDEAIEQAFSEGDKKWVDVSRDIVGEEASKQYGLAMQARLAKPEMT